MILYVVQQPKFVEHKSFRFKLSSSMGIHGHPWAFRVQFGIEGFVEWCATGSSALEIVLLQEDPEQEFVGWDVVHGQQMSIASWNILEDHQDRQTIYGYDGTWSSMIYVWEQRLRRPRTKCTVHLHGLGGQVGRKPHVTGASGVCVCQQETLPAGLGSCSLVWWRYLNQWNTGAHKCSQTCSEHRNHAGKKNAAINKQSIPRQLFSVGQGF